MRTTTTVYKCEQVILNLKGSLEATATGVRCTLPIRQIRTHEAIHWHERRGLEGTSCRVAGWQSTSGIVNSPPHHQNLHPYNTPPQRPWNRSWSHAGASIATCPICAWENVATGGYEIRTTSSGPPIECHILLQVGHDQMALFLWGRGLRRPPYS